MIGWLAATGADRRLGGGIGGLEFWLEQVWPSEYGVVRGSRGGGSGLRGGDGRVYLCLLAANGTELAHWH